MIHAADRNCQTWFQTASGHVAFVDFPQGSHISIEDIAASLSRVCRYGGHLRDDVDHYSVAQHCVLVSYLVDPALAFLGLMHDAAEAYVQDLIRPLKLSLPGYKPIEREWEEEIGRRFGLGDQLANLPAEVKRADLQALATERRDLLMPGRRYYDGGQEPAPFQLCPLGRRDAERAFLRRFEELSGGR